MIDDVGVGSVVEQLGSDGCASALCDLERGHPEQREWFIRNMPSDLIEQVKAAAKVGRMTVGEWLTQKLRHIIAEESGVLDDGARISKLEKEVEDAHQRIDGICEILTAEREAKRRAERGPTADEVRERYRQMKEGRR